ncbi:hypothetical protein AgCh_006209 [Apium graveolens]
MDVSHYIDDRRHLKDEIKYLIRRGKFGRFTRVKRLEAKEEIIIEKMMIEEVITEIVTHSPEGQISIHNNVETTTEAITPTQGKTPDQTHSKDNASELAESVEALKANFTIKEGVLSLVEIGKTSDTVNLVRSDEFLEKGTRQWDTSIIGHYIGSSFDFKFVRDQTMKLWKHKGLSRVYYSSRGYFTLHCGTVEGTDAVLAINTVQIGTKQIPEKIEILCEGIEEVRSNQRRILVSQYEGFMAKPKEGITEVFERFNKLINDLQLHDNIMKLRRLT